MQLCLEGEQKLTQTIRFSNALARGTQSRPIQNAERAYLSANRLEQHILSTWQNSLHPQEKNSHERRRIENSY
jgi:hypothetical protein